MVLDLYVTIHGVVAPDVVKLLVNGVEKPLTGQHYAVEVHVVDDVVALTTVDRLGRERTRTIRMNSVDLPIV